MRWIASLVLVLGFVGCGRSTPPSVAAPTAPGAVATSSVPSARPASSAPAPSGLPDRVAGWRADLDGLVPAMAALHPDLYHDTPKADLDRVIGDLKSKVASASDDELLVGMAHAVALVSAHGRDAHTGLYPWSPASRFPVHSLPLRLWLFPDGIHVIAALAPYQALVGVRIETIAGHPAADVVKALDPLVPRDNDATVRLLTPRFLLTPEVLHGLGLIDAVGPVELAVVDTKGARRSVSVGPIPIADYNAWAGGYGLFLPADPKVLYLSRTEEPFWWTRLDGGTIYVQYNRVEGIGGTPLTEFLAAAGSPTVKRVVVDIRHNFGGEVGALAEVVDAMDDPNVDRPGRLYLITGRNTFSAASMFAGMLKARTGVTIVGEPMGGSPNPYGDNEDISLRWSGLSVSVATVLELATTKDDVRLTIEPDVAVPLTYADWAAGRDAALEAIRARP